MSKRATIFLSLVISLIISACTGLGGEPEIVATVPIPTSVADTTEDEPLYPQSQPDIANGAQLFAEHCTDCHGDNGNGQGSLVLEGSIAQPIDMTDLTVTSLKSPLEWYNTITNGRIENLMPPWKSALTAKERWDVAFYTYTLGYSADVLELGEQVWTNKCNGCESLQTLSNLETAVALSDTSFGNQIDRDDFGSTLSVDEIRAAVAYARSLSVENPESIAFLAEPLPVGEDPNITIGNLTGTVQHGTADATVPADTIIQLQYGNASDGFQFEQTTLNDDLTYTFTDIPLTTAYTYHVGAAYRERIFTNTLLEGHPDDIDYHQEITIYDLTDDVGVISISRIDMFIDPFNVQDVGSGLRITQLIRYNNSSDRMYTTGRETGDGREAVLLIQVPVGSLITSGEANGRYIIIQNMEDILNSVIDTYPVLPGDDHEVAIEYFVPYEDGAIIDQPFSNLIDGEVTITISNNLTVISEDLSLQEESNTGETLKVYAGDVTLDNNPSLIFEIAGSPFATTSDDETVVTTDTLFPILLGVVIVLAVVMVIFVVVSNRGNNNSHSIDALIKQIAELDAMHESGQINHDVYQQQRQALKEQLTALMQQDNPVDQDA